MGGFGFLLNPRGHNGGQPFFLEVPDFLGSIPVFCSTILQYRTCLCIQLQSEERKIRRVGMANKENTVPFAVGFPVTANAMPQDFTFCDQLAFILRRCNNQPAMLTYSPF